MRRYNNRLAAGFTALALILGLGLAACQSGGKHSGDPAAAETAESGNSEEAEENSRSDGRKNTGKAEGYQFVSGYGICEPGQDVIWQLAPGDKPSVENEMGKAELLQAVYQNQVLTVTVRLTDRSVTKVSDKDRDAFLDKEKENQLLLEQGQPVEELPGYICIDSESQIYVNSPLQARIADRQKRGMGDRLYGAGITDRGFSFNSSGTQTDYDSFLNDGYLMSISEKRITAVHFDMKEPEGTYTLQLAGFDDPIEFSFVKAPEYGNLDEIGGITEEGDGCYMMASGVKKEKGISVFCYTWPGEGYDRMRLTGVKLSVETADGKQQTLEQSTAFHPELFPVNRGNALFRGIVNGNREEFWFEAPEEMDVRSAALTASSALMRSDAVSDEVTIPVPQGELPLDETVEIGDAKLHLTGVRSLDERFEIGYTDGEPILWPAVYVTASLELGESEKQIESLYGIDSKYKFGSPELQYVDSLSSRYTKVEADMGEQGNEELKGLRLYYEDGQQELKIRFTNPLYRWDRNFEVPLRIGKTLPE